jgi:hypothetical protein
LWRPDIVPPWMAEAVVNQHGGVVRIIRPGRSWSRTVRGSSPLAIPGQHSGEIALLQYWFLGGTGDYLAHGKSEGLDCYVVMPQAITEAAAEELFAVLKARFFAGQMWMFISRVPWFPEGTRFPVQFPFLPPGFHPREGLGVFPRVQCGEDSGQVGCGIVTR